MNSSGVVDACVTTDGDVFLYGATKVYRNLNADVKKVYIPTISRQLSYHTDHIYEFF